MRHVAYLIPTIDRIGGAEQQVILLATGLKKRGWNVSVICLSGTGGDAREQLESAGVGFLSLEMRKGLADSRGWIRLCRWMREKRPDVVHAHLPHATLMARWSRLLQPARVLVDTIHSPATGGPARRLGYQLSASLPDVVTAVSRAARGPWLTSGMVNRRNFEIIPNGVDLDHWKSDGDARAAIRRQLHLSNQFLWLAVGRLDPVKDHATLLRAFAKLPSNARLMIVGGGPLESQLRSLAQDLNLSDRVDFLGFRSDVLPFMRAADGFVLSSRWEGLPIALLEAGACELPAVATDIPGARQVISDSLRCSTVAVGDAEALAEAMKAFMSMPEIERRELGRAARQSVSERFSLDAVLNNWEALYRVLLERNPQPLRFGNADSALDRTLQVQ